MSYDNNLTGALFKNDRKDTENHPDYRGECEVAGTEYWLSAWVKTSKAGRKYFSLSFREKGAMPDEPPSTPAPADDFSDEIPF